MEIHLMVRLKGIDMSDKNWNALTEETESLLDHQYMYGNRQFTFFGLVHASDDFYYGMYDPNMRELRFLSCVGSIENGGFEHISERCIKCLKDDMDMSPIQV